MFFHLRSEHAGSFGRRQIDHGAMAEGMAQNGQRIGSRRGRLCADIVEIVTGNRGQRYARRQNAKIRFAHMVLRFQFLTYFLTFFLNRPSFIDRARSDPPQSRSGLPFRIAESGAVYRRTTLPSLVLPTAHAALALGL